MSNHLTMKDRELRKINKKIRHLKSKESWDMKKIDVMEEKSSLLKKEIIHDQKKMNEMLTQKAKEEKMTDDDWIDHFSGGEPMTINDHIIPNTRETRLHRKRVIKNIQTHMIDEEVVRQLQLKRIMDAIDGIQKEQTLKPRRKKSRSKQITS